MGDSKNIAFGENSMLGLGEFRGDNDEAILKALLDEEFHYVMDTEWTLRCEHFIKSAVINKSCSAFRVSGHNKTSQHIKNNIVVPKHAEERKKYYLLHIHPILKRFGPGERFIFKSGHVLSVMYYKLAKIVALIRYLIRGSI